MNNTARDAANDLMFPGSPGYVAAHQNVGYVGAILITLAFSLGYWFGYQGPEKNQKYKIWNLIALVILLFFAGSMLGLQGGIIFVFVAGICFGGGFLLGNNQYKRTHS